MNTTNLKQQLAAKYESYQERKALGLDGLTIGIEEKPNDTVENQIYNKLHARSIEIAKLENKYIKENKEIDITKTTKTLKDLDKQIEKVTTSLNKFSKEYQEQIEELQNEELKNEHSVLGRIGVIEKYNKLSENMENLPVYQNLSIELNDLKVQRYMIEKKVAEYEHENRALISEIMRHKRREEVEQYLQSKEI